MASLTRRTVWQVPKSAKLGRDQCGRLDLPWGALEQTRSSRVISFIAFTLFIIWWAVVCYFCWHIGRISNQLWMSNEPPKKRKCCTSTACFHRWGLGTVVWHMWQAQLQPWVHPIKTELQCRLRGNVASYTIHAMYRLYRGYTAIHSCVGSSQ